MSIDALTHYTALNSDTVKETQIQVETLSSKKKFCIWERKVEKGDIYGTY